MARNAKNIQTKSTQMEVSHVAGNHWTVKSTSGNTYSVFYNGKHSTCNCKWGQYRPDAVCGCAHVVAVIAKVENAQISAWATQEDADRQHRHEVDTLVADGLVLTARRS